MSNILIVDDSKTSRKFIRNLLESKEFTVIGEAENGIEGVEMYQKLKPDLVLMDVTMPLLDGIDALREIRQIDKDAKVIMVTAAGQKSNIMEALKLGAVDYIQKPFDEEQLAEAIKRGLYD